MALTGRAVTVRRYTTDRYGDRTETTSFTVAHCAFAPRVTTENTDRSEQVRAEAELYAPAAADIQPSDVVELHDGTRWEVQGRPENWESPWDGWQPGHVVPLIRVTG